MMELNGSDIVEMTMKGEETAPALWSYVCNRSHIVTAIVQCQADMLCLPHTLIL